MTLVFATHNLGKLKEVKALLPHLTVKGLTEIGCTEDIVEDAPTIEGNAILKAKYVKENYGLDCIADDSGLEIEALNGDPGVFSARYAGLEKDPQKNIEKVLRNLAAQSNKNAQFKTVIAYAKQETITTFEGICKGQIIEEQRGENGFGYDPIFIPESHTQTFAEMTDTEKGQLSHRAKAIEQFIGHLDKS